MKSERFDIHQHITDQIIAAIESGAGEFRLPWHRSAGNIMRPVNIASKNAYRSVNILTLWATADEKGYSSGGAYKQRSRNPAVCRTYAYLFQNSGPKVMPVAGSVYEPG